MSVRYNIENNTGSVISVKDTKTELKKHRFLPIGVSTLIVPDEEDPVINTQLVALVAKFPTTFAFTPESGELASIINLGAPAAEGATAIHAALAGNDADNNFPGPFTNPDVPRAVSAVAAASYDGGDITVVGTDQFGKAQTDTIVAVAASTVDGVKIFKTVTSAKKAAVGGNAATVSIGSVDKLGVPAPLSADAILFTDDTPEAVTNDVTNNAVTPTTAANGSVEFKVLNNIAAA